MNSSALNPRAILVVDDEKDIREGVRELLESAGYRVTTAANGLEALRLAPTVEGLALVLLDMNMPVMGGAEFLYRLRLLDEYRSLPVVIVSATPQPVDAQGILKKPFQISALLELVEKHCAPT